MAVLGSNAARGDELRLMIANPEISTRAIADWLDGLGTDHEARYEQVCTLGWRAQRALYARAVETEAERPVDLEHLVPTEDAGQPVVHDGWNSIPLPGVSLFQKVFVRPTEDVPDIVYGYNDGPLRPLLGPGYFVAEPSALNPGWTHRGGVVIDYFQTPPQDATLPDTWPESRPNGEGLQQFVYGGTRDFLRRVSEHVCIGAAFKGELAIESFFVLVRRPVYDAPDDS